MENKGDAEVMLHTWPKESGCYSQAKRHRRGGPTSVDGKGRVRRAIPSAALLVNGVASRTDPQLSRSKIPRRAKSRVVPVESAAPLRPAQSLVADIVKVNFVQAHTPRPYTTLINCAGGSKSAPMQLALTV